MQAHHNYVQAGCQGVHSVVKTFKKEVDAERVLQVDATSVFNKINGKVMPFKEGRN